MYSSLLVSRIRLYSSVPSSFILLSFSLFQPVSLSHTPTYTRAVKLIPRNRPFRNRTTWFNGSLWVRVIFFRFQKQNNSHNMGRAVAPVPAKRVFFSSISLPVSSTLLFAPSLSLSLSRPHTKARYHSFFLPLPLHSSRRVIKGKLWPRKTNVPRNSY